LICEKCNIDMLLDHLNGEIPIYQCVNPACTDYHVEKQGEPISLEESERSKPDQKGKSNV
jgi:hypothetical protein